MTARGFVTIEAVLPLDDTLAAIRSADAGIVVVTVGACFPKLERAMLMAAIGPLATELAPAQRLFALDVGTDATADAVAETLRFLARAHSSTGQILTVR